MTNPTLERAARAAWDHPASFADDCWIDGVDNLDLASVVVDGHVNLIEIARAVLMAVLPDGDGSISDIVVCDYIRAILAEGE